MSSPNHLVSRDPDLQDHTGEGFSEDLPGQTPLSSEETGTVLCDNHTLSPSISLLPLLSMAGPPQKPNVDPVDLRTLDYVGVVDHNLMCAICHSPFVSPVKLECDHYFCRSCVIEAMTHQNAGARCCPACRRKTNRTPTLVPKIIDHILDELKVRCPFFSMGCIGELARGSIQNHVDRYCNYSEIECPSVDCSHTIERKDLAKNRCLHNVISCEDCGFSFMERDLEHHRTIQCVRSNVECPHCQTEVLHENLKQHIDRCPEAMCPCQGACYGCNFISKRANLDGHLAVCPIAKLVPFLKVQNERLEAHEAALRHLKHKNTILESSFQSIQEALGPSRSLVDAPSAPSDMSDTAPFDSTAHHLLCLHESLREEVGRVSAAVSALDAKASMMVMNESLRTKEDLTHTNAAIGGMRMQLHWLMSLRLQSQQRMAVGRTLSTGEDTVAGPSASPGDPLGPDNLPMRRLSDSTRQETKL